MVQLPTGKVLFFGDRKPADNTTHAWLYDPAFGKLKQVDPPSIRHPRTGVMAPANIFCGGQSLLPDGRVLVTGGVLEYSGGAADLPRYTGLNTAFTFNPYNETWTRQPDMDDGRFYPTQTLMPNGETAIMGGTDAAGGEKDYINQDVEIFTPSPDLDGVGSIRPVTSASGVETPNKEWYPHTFVMASGRALLAGPERQMSWYLDAVGRSTYSWTDAPDPSRLRDWSTAVLMPSPHTGGTRVLQLGGAAGSGTARESVASTETFDETSDSWSSGAPMQVARGHHNTVLLPDGSMVTVGGGVGSADGGKSAWRPEHRQIELWDPGRDEWRLGPSQTETRSYHSTAVLLPDGRVFSGGDDGYGGRLQDIGEIYEPPYLHRGPRPTVTEAPAAVRYRVGFTVETPDEISRVVLVAPGATTHGTDMNQRHVTLPLARRDDGRGVDVQAPTGPNAAPPGPYMLFVLDADGVPSVAKWVRVGAGGEPLPGYVRSTPTPTPTPSPSTPPPTASGAPADPADPAPPSVEPAAGVRPPVAGAPPGSPASPTKPRRRRSRPLAARLTLSSLVRGGASVPVSCRRACTIAVALRVDRAAAKRHRFANPMIASGVRRLRRGGSARVVMRATRSARSRLTRVRALRGTLEVRIGARGVRERRSARRLTLVR